MSEPALEQRRKQLENAFFAKLNQEKLVAYREKLSHDDCIDRLAERTHIQDKTLLERLLGLGITTETITALSLYPIVAIAWADGWIQPKERIDIGRALRNREDCTEEVYELFDHWLEEQPSPEVFEAWRDYTQALCKEISSQEKENLKQEVLDLANKISVAAGGLFDFIGGVTDTEKKILEQIEEAFA